jgi:hypothetical protein
MKNSFLIPIILLLFLLLVGAIETLIHRIGLINQVENFLMNYYFVFLFIIEVAFLFLIIRNLKYSHQE